MLPAVSFVSGASKTFATRLNNASKFRAKGHFNWYNFFLIKIIVYKFVKKTIKPCDNDYLIYLCFLIGFVSVKKIFFSLYSEIYENILKYQIYHILRKYQIVCTQ